MSEAINRLKVDVEDLRKGMYVAEPDRPWVDLPLPFAGFTIQNDEELKILREYCSHVYIDPERCAASGDERDLGTDKSQGAVEQSPGRQRSADAEADDGIDDSRREVDTDKLSKRMEAASKSVAGARRFLDEAFSGARDGKALDLPTAQSAITDLVGQLTKNPTASLLLTSLNRRDSFTSTHSVHVCLLVLAFCLRAQVDPRKLEILGLGALLHDIGKVELPTELIDRAGPLSEDEWELVKRHPEAGHRILGDSGKVPRPVLEIARMHHERRDGTGYPGGLTRAELPDYVLVTALVNRYQSLTSPRPYRGASSPDQVLRSFYADADKMYGSRPVEAFIRCIGIYPVGSVVELDNGALGVVVSSRPNTRVRPVVQLVRTPDGEPYQKLVLLNLAAEVERWEKKDDKSPIRSVRRVRSPSDTGIDPGAVIAQSFGVEMD